MAVIQFNQASKKNQEEAIEVMDKLVTRVRFAPHKNFFAEIVDSTLEELPATKEGVDLKTEFGIYVNRIERTARKLGMEEREIAQTLTRVADWVHAPDDLVDIAVQAAERIELNLR